MVGSGECKGSVGILTEQQEKDIERMLNQESYNMHYGLRNGSYSLRTNSESKINMAINVLKVLGYCAEEVDSIRTSNGVRYLTYKIIKASDKM